MKIFIINNKFNILTKYLNYEVFDFNTSSKVESDDIIISFEDPINYQHIKAKFIYIDLSISGKNNELGYPKILYPNEVMIIKTTFIDDLIDKVKNNKELDGCVNHYSNGITSLECIKLINKTIDGNKFYNRIQHFYSPNILSEYEIMNLINNVFKSNCKINSVRKDFCDISLNSIYDHEFPIPSLKDQLNEINKLFY